MKFGVFTILVSVAAALEAEGPVAYSELARRERAWDYSIEGAAALGENTTDAMARRAGAADLTVECGGGVAGRLGLGDMLGEEPSVAVGVNAMERGEYLTDKVQDGLEVVDEGCHYTLPGKEGVRRIYTGRVRVKGRRDLCLSHASRDPWKSVVFLERCATSSARFSSQGFSHLYTMQRNDSILPEKEKEDGEFLVVLRYAEPSTMEIERNGRVEEGRVITMVHERVDGKRVTLRMDNRTLVR